MILPAAGVRQRIDELDFLGRHGRAEFLAGMAEQVAAQVLVGGEPVFEQDERLDHFADRRIGLADDAPPRRRRDGRSSALSTSNGPIRCPEDLITSSARPTNQ